MTSPTSLVARHRHVRGARRRYHRAGAAPLREVAAACAACLTLAAVIPLALSQIPNGLAWSLPHIQLTSPGSQIAVLRACGLSLPAMLATVPYAAVAIRRLGAGWPMLLVGLGIIALADLTTGLPWVAELRGTDPSRLLAFIAADRVLHGAGAGLALAGAATLAGGTRRGVVWVLTTAAGLAGAPLLVRARVSAVPGDWLTALRPAGWLTTVALTATALWLPLAGHTSWRRRGPRRHDAGERDRLALVAAPLAAMALLMVAVSFRSVDAVVGTAISAVFVVVILTAMLARDTGRAFECVCALAGFTLMPGASVLTGTHPLPAPVGAALIVVVTIGFAMALVHTLGASAADTSAALINGTVLLIGAAGAGYLAVGAMMVHG